MTLKRRAVLTVECRNMKKPKLCRSRFDQTLEDNSWVVRKHEKADINDDATVTTLSTWSRIFGGRKTEDDVMRITGNLLKRAAKDAGIDDYRFELSFEIPDGNG